MAGTLDFSIIIPTCNRPALLANCLEAISRLGFPRSRFEVIVIDDGCCESVDSVCARFDGLFSLNLVRQQRQGPAAARNQGGWLAKGRFLAFLDDDCEPGPEWLTVLYHYLAEQPDQLVGGEMLNGLVDNLYSSASQQLLAWLYHYFNHHSAQPRFFATCNLALPTQGFVELGGFDTSFPLAAAEDRDFCDRWRIAGLKMAYAAQAHVYHYHHLTLASYWRQHFNYGRGACRFHARHHERTRSRVPFEPLYFYWGILRSPFHAPEIQRPWPVAMLLALSQIANLSGYLCERFFAWE